MSPKKLLLLTASSPLSSHSSSSSSAACRRRRSASARAISTGTSRRRRSSASRSRAAPRSSSSSARDPSHWKMIRPQKYPADAFAVANVASELAELKRAGGDCERRPSGRLRPRPARGQGDVRLDRSGRPEGAQDADDRVRLAGPRHGRRRGAGGRDAEGPLRARLRPDGPQEERRRFREQGGLRGAVLGRSRGSRSCAGAAASSSPARTGPGGSPSRSRTSPTRARPTGWSAQLTALRVREFVHGTDDLAAQGLNPPLFRVDPTDAKGAVTAVDFGATRSDGNSIYARRDGQVFTVDRDVVEELSKEAEAVPQPRRSSAFDRSDVVGSRGRLRRRMPFALVQKDGGWTAAGRPVLAAAADDVDRRCSTSRARSSSTRPRRRPWRLRSRR